MASTFNHFDLKLIQPAFGSSLTDLVIELDHLRKNENVGCVRRFAVTHRRASNECFMPVMGLVFLPYLGGGYAG